MPVDLGALLGTWIILSSLIGLSCFFSCVPAAIPGLLGTALSICCCIFPNVCSTFTSLAGIPITLACCTLPSAACALFTGVGAFVGYFSSCALLIPNACCSLLGCLMCCCVGGLPNLLCEVLYCYCCYGLPYSIFLISGISILPSLLPSVGCTLLGLAGVFLSLVCCTFPSVCCALLGPATSVPSSLVCCTFPGVIALSTGEEGAGLLESCPIFSLAELCPPA